MSITAESLRVQGNFLSQIEAEGHTILYKVDALHFCRTLFPDNNVTKVFKGNYLLCCMDGSKTHVMRLLVSQHRFYSQFTAPDNRFHRREGDITVDCCIQIITIHSKGLQLRGH